MVCEEAQTLSPDVMQQSPQGYVQHVAHQPILSQVSYRLGNCYKTCLSYVTIDREQYGALVDQPLFKY